MTMPMVRSVTDKCVFRSFTMIQLLQLALLLISSFIKVVNVHEIQTTFNYEYLQGTSDVDVKGFVFMHVQFIHQIIWILLLLLYGCIMLPFMLKLFRILCIFFAIFSISISLYVNILNKSICICVN